MDSSDDFDESDDESSETSEMSETSETSETSDSSESDADGAEDGPQWLYDIWELKEFYELLSDNADAAAGRVQAASGDAGAQGARNAQQRALRVDVALYIARTAHETARELDAMMRNPPQWTEKQGEAYAERVQRVADWREFMFEQLLGRYPEVRRDYMSTEDREAVLETIDDPEIRRIVATWTSKTGVALKAALAVAKMKARVNKNAADNWHPDGPRGAALVERYAESPFFPSRRAAGHPAPLTRRASAPTGKSLLPFGPRSSRSSRPSGSPPRLARSTT